MFGQGRPHHRSWFSNPRRSTSRSVGRLRPIALVVSMLLACGTAAGIDQLDVRVRLAWGGGESRLWTGTIRLSEGTLSEVIPLGFEPDAPASMLLLDSSTLRIAARTPRSYDGCDMRVQAPASAKLLVQLTADPMGTAAPLELPLTRLLREFSQFNLDDRNNRLLAHRSPGDSLRIEFSHPSLVFSPGEKFEFQVQPQHLDLASNSTYVLAAGLSPARTEEPFWSDDRELRVEAAGAVPSAAFSVSLPDQEGIYDLRL